jgi:hypothetical protein
MYLFLIIISDAELFVWSMESTFCPNHDGLRLLRAANASAAAQVRREDDT